MVYGVRSCGPDFIYFRRKEGFVYDIFELLIKYFLNALFYDQFVHRLIDGIRIGNRYLFVILRIYYHLSIYTLIL